MYKNTVSNKTIRLFMSKLIAEAQKSDSTIVSLQSRAVADLRNRKDFNSVLRVLQGLGYCEILWADCNVPINLHFTDKGLTYFETDRDIRNERNWSHWLSIIAILTSLATLALELSDRGWFGFLKP